MATLMLPPSPALFPVEPPPSPMNEDDVSSTADASIPDLDLGEPSWSSTSDATPATSTPVFGAPKSINADINETTNDSSSPIEQEVEPSSTQQALAAVPDPLAVPVETEAKAAVETPVEAVVTNELAKADSEVHQPQEEQINNDGNAHDNALLMDQEMDRVLSEDDDENDNATADAHADSTQLPGGLSNLGNTCYMASALQMLASVEPLMEQLVQAAENVPTSTQSTAQEVEGEEDAAGHEPTTQPSVLTEWVHVLQRLRKGETVHPQDLKHVLDMRTPLFCGYEQQDSHEFITTLLDLLDEDLKTLHKKNQPQPHNENTDIVTNYKSETVEEDSNERRQSEPAVEKMEVDEENANPKQPIVDKDSQDKDEPLVQSESMEDNDINQNENSKSSTTMTTSAIVGVTHASSSSDEMAANKRLKTETSFLSSEDSMTEDETDESSEEEPRQELQNTSDDPVNSRAFSDLNMDEIGVLLHGREKDAEHETSSVATSTSTSSEQQPRCKLVGGRMNVELRHDSVVTSHAGGIIAPTNGESRVESNNENDGSDAAMAGESTDSAEESSSDQDNQASSSSSQNASADTEPEYKSPVDDYLTMEVRARLTCDSCKYTRAHKETFSHLSLELGGEDATCLASVEDGLARFFAPEQRQLKCEKCFCETATQTMQITKLPRALLLHFKRFIVEVSEDYTSVSYRKNTSPVSFDTCLHVSEQSAFTEDDASSAEFCVEAASSQPASVLSDFLAHDCIVPRCEDTSSNGDGTTSCCSSHRKNGQHHTYSLASVVNHIGSSASCGHYTADAFRQNSWLRFNDSYVSRITREQATEEAASTAYMLMYEMK